MLYRSQSPIILKLFKSECSIQNYESTFHFIFFYKFNPNFSITHVVHIRMVKFAYRHPLIYKFSKLRKTEANALRVLHGFADDVIRKRRQELMGNVNRLENDQENGTDCEVGARKKRALLDILLYSSIDEKPLSDMEIRDEVDIFIFAVPHIN